MSELFSKIHDEIKSAMLSKDLPKRDCLRAVVSEIKNQTVNANPPKEIDDGTCLKVLRKSAKTHGDSISQFETAGRTDFVERERAELAVIESFLPKMLDETATEALLRKIISDGGIEPSRKSMGLVMKALSASSDASLVDRKLASTVLQRILS